MESELSGIFQLQLVAKNGAWVTGNPFYFDTLPYFISKSLKINGVLLSRILLYFQVFES